MKDLAILNFTEKEDVTRTVTLILGCIYTWIMILSFLVSTSNDPEVDKRKNDTATNIERILQLMMNSMNIEAISMAIRYTITSIFNGIGRFNVSRNIPFVSSIILKDSDSIETYESSKFYNDNLYSYQKSRREVHNATSIRRRYYHFFP